MDEEGTEDFLNTATSDSTTADIGCNPMVRRVRTSGDATHHAPDPLAERYGPGERIGAGGMGEVRECLDRSLGRTVALKSMTPCESSDRRRFLREVMVQAQLEHPAIVPVYDLESDGETPRFTMKRIQGVTLRRVLRPRRDEEPLEGFPLRRLLGALSTVCLAVDYAHSRGVTHRDIKPANIMLGNWGEVYLLDWGIARVEQDEPDDGVKLDHTSLRDGEPDLTRMAGTPGYLAPEILAGASPGDVRSDIYSLGCVLFEILSKHPLHRGSAVSKIRSTASGVDPTDRLRQLELEAAPEFGIEVDPELMRICHRALAQDPEQRYASARAMQEEIDSFLAGDRDSELRRDMANQLAESAAEHMDQALEEGGGEERRSALQDLFGALAIDRSHAGAYRGLVRLLSTPPREVPTEVLRQMERAEARRMSTLVAPSAATHFFFALLVALLAWMGALSWPLVALSVGVGILLIPALYYERRLARKQAQEANPSLRWRHDILPLTLICALLGILTNIAGPWIFIPPVLVAVTIFRVLRDQRQAWLVTLLAICALVFPAILQWTGLVEASYTFTDRGMLITPIMVGLPQLPATIFFVVGAVLCLIVAGAVAQRFRRALRDAELQVQLHAWQLAQVLPDDGVISSEDLVAGQGSGTKASS